MHAGALHQLDVDAVVGLGGTAHVGEALQVFVGDDGQRRALAQPCGLLEHLFRHGLLDKQAAALGQPVAHVEGFLLVGPALVGVHTDGSVEAAAECLGDFLVVVEAHLDFHHLERSCLVDFGVHLRGVGVIADGVGGIGRVVGIQAPDFIPGLTHNLSGEVVQGYVDRCLCGAVVGCDRLHICVDVLDAEGVRELCEVERVEEFAHALDALAEIWRHGGLAVTDHAVIFDLHLNVGGCGALVPCQVERVAQFQFIRLKRKIEAPRAWSGFCRGGAGGSREGYGSGGKGKAQRRCFQEISTVHGIIFRN